eukprot:3776831-Ditylum_brightwellii.AAC.1
MPQYVKDTKTAFHNIFPDKIKSGSKAINIHNSISLDSSDSDDSSVFMPREVKKKQEKDNNE